MTTDASFSCQLTDAALAERARTWEGVGAHITGGERIDGGFRVTFEPAATEQLRGLVAAERTCCSWATWTMRSGASATTLEVTGPAGPIDALAAAFGL